ncbi:MAG: iron-sulfur cluster assembly scaffold protein [Candidatus Gracilibacteria bacterium]|nr:iron-sulfur cluster assembly scaffold protein [Candidatus Gracilibacteria bacterium]
MTNEIITYYSKTPPNKFEMRNFTIRYKEENRSCSDTIEIFLLIENNILKDWSFEGITSIITTATSSVFGESIVGMTLDEILQKDYNYIIELIGEEVSPRRQKSAIFGLIATRNAIHKYLQDGKNDDILSFLPN